MSSFIGRSDELVELRRLVRTTRLLTLTGPAGVGKTRLALELAGLEQRSGRCEIALVELGSVSTGEEVRKRIAVALDGAAEGCVRLAGARGAAGADRERLLVLDNCEHVLDDCGLVLSGLLPHHPGLRILATSRESLRLPGETVYSVSGLGLPDLEGGASLTGMLGSDAVRLFVDRARAVSCAFELTEDNAAHVAALCAGLDGLPLALELAAGLVRAFPPAALHDRLGDRLSLLTCGWRTADPRHQSLRSAIEWSYDLLTPVQRSLLRSLSLLPGSFGPDTATALAVGKSIPASAVPELLADLEAKSLIIPCVDRGSSARFRMLESIRCYGRERLRAENEEGAAYDLLVDWLAELARPLRETAFTPAEPRRRLAEERDSLTWLLEWSSAGSDPRRLLLTSALAVVDIHRGQPTEKTRALLADVLARTDPGADDRSIALGTAAWLAAEEGDYDEAIRLANEAVTLERRRPRPNTPLLCRVLLTLSAARTHRGDQGSRADLEECLEISDRAGDPVATAFCLTILARQSLLAGDVARAARLVDEVLPVLRAEAGPSLLRMTLVTAGVLALERDDPATAEAYFAEALGGTGHPGGASLALWGLAVTAVRDGRFERGLRLCATAETHSALAASELPPWFRARVEEAADKALMALPKAQAKGALVAGRELEARQVLAYALHGRLDVPARPEGVVDGTVGGTGGDDPLSSREWDVIALVTTGLTNRQIAARLHLSVRTVETHVRNIRTTLGLRSRTHVAAWAARQAG
ncbi:LuxR family transcriptional regulator [Streptomyces djakartensis]|uniref:LuxR family transcriptional regulator n=1 Tax=Streptomyces djakartensis TaxID=68193 RepID=A0ABQ3AKQ0_9ACTN|nr:LuxR family transcriptional regulator [Streptomyces djakartensis]